MKTNPRIRPYKTNDGYDYYIVFTGPNSFRDPGERYRDRQRQLYARPRESGQHTGQQSAVPGRRHLSMTA